VALAALWGYAGTGLASDALRQRADADRVSSAGESVQRLVSRLQDERLRTAAWQGEPDSTSRAALDTARTSTDEAVDAFRAARSTVGSGSGTAADRAAGLTRTLDGLAELRGSVDDGTAAEIGTFTGYTAALAEGTALFAVAVQADSGTTGRGSAAVTSLVRIGESLSRGEALLHLAALDDGDNGAVEQQFAFALAAQRESRLALHGRDLPTDQAAAYTRLTGGEPWEILTAAEAPAGSGTPGLPANPGAWAEAADGIGGQLGQLATDALDEVGARSGSEANRTLLIVALGTLVALAALAGSAVLARRAWQSLSGRMAELAHSTRELTEQRLPELTEQLQRAKPEIPADLTPERERKGDELDRVAAATEYQWRQMVESLISQAQSRAGTETVLLGLARRTQSLINRMIPKLDKLEREHQDSRLLKDIFVVDHLATRVRRHTENLLILGGSLPSRRWGKPVPIYEVVRSAISETEDYSRVEAMPGPPVSLTGRAVADVSHLLAELIENGSSFSPPETKVTVSAQVVAKGRMALEVMDRGLGMSPGEYDRLNQLLADPPKLDITKLGNSPRLGLLVVARLAKRHGLEVVLRHSPYGGTLAVVLLPSSLLEQAKTLLPGIMADGGRTDADPVSDADRTTPAPTPTPAPAHAVLVGAGAPTAPADSSVSWIGDDGTGYPSYAGAGLVAPGTAGTPIPTPEPEPERHATPPPQRRRRTPPSGTSTPSVADGLPMVSGGAGLLPPADAPSTPSTDHAEGFGASSRPAVPESAAAAPTAAAGTSDGQFDRDISNVPDIVHTREAPLTPHAEDFRPRRRGSDATTGPDTSGAMSAEPARRDESSIILPVRVRGENLAEGLRAQQSPLERDGKGLSDSAPSPERAARTIGAIQWGNRRARAAAAADARSPEDQDQAASPGHATGSEEPARKDQR
jgi:signal transduction histidine kinase